MSRQDRGPEHLREYLDCTRHVHGWPAHPSNEHDHPGGNVPHGHGGTESFWACCPGIPWPAQEDPDHPLTAEAREWFAARDRETAACHARLDQVRLRDPGIWMKPSGTLPPDPVRTALWEAVRGHGEHAEVLAGSRDGLPALLDALEPLLAGEAGQP